MCCDGHGTVFSSDIGDDANFPVEDKSNYTGSVVVSRSYRVGELIVDGCRLSVRPSVCPVPDPKSRMEGHSELKIVRKKAMIRVTVTPFRCRRSTVKVGHKSKQLQFFPARPTAGDK